MGDRLRNAAVRRGVLRQATSEAVHEAAYEARRCGGRLDERDVADVVLHVQPDASQVAPRRQVVVQRDVSISVARQVTYVAQ